MSDLQNIVSGDATNVIALLTRMKILSQEEGTKSSNDILSEALNGNHQNWRYFQDHVLIVSSLNIKGDSVPIRCSLS